MGHFIHPHLNPPPFRLHFVAARQARGEEERCLVNIYVIYAEKEKEELTVITVYVYFGKWEKK